jgi:hypothetical protein
MLKKISKLILIFFLLPSLAFSKAVNLSCNKLYTELYENGTTKIKKDSDKVIFIKIDNNRFYFSGDEIGTEIHKTTDDYYYYFKDKDSNWQNVIWDLREGSGQFRINRMNGIYEYWENIFSETKTGFKIFYQCEVVKNKF